MSDINNDHGAAAGATFPIAMYVFFLSYLALLLVPCSGLMHVLSLMCVVKYACASVMLFSVINLTRKLPNNPTVTSQTKRGNSTENYVFVTFFFF
jgi:hypothetical protein